MADSLDDFFAKKDKKRKNKSQAAALSAEALVRELEEGAAKPSDYSARRENKTSAAMEILGLNTNDNDWKDFEEVEKRDYTGLKVKEMSIQDQEEEQRQLTDQIDQLPESIPWKSKQETVAAIISAKDETSNPLSSELLESTDATTSKTSTTTTTTATSTINTAAKTTDPTTNTTSTATGATDKDASKETAAASSTQGAKSDDPEPAASSAEMLAADKKPEEGKSKPVDQVPQKDGDTKPVVVKKAYVPPHERMQKEVAVLEPIKLSKLKGTSSRAGASINIQDKNMFPSLG